MKYKKIKAQLIEYLGYDTEQPFTTKQKELIKDVNVVVTDHYKTKLDIQAEKYHNSLDEKNRQLMELTVFNDGLEKQRRLDEAVINGLRKEIVDKEKAYQQSIDEIKIEESKARVQCIRALLSDQKYNFGLIVKPIN